MPSWPKATTATHPDNAQASPLMAQSHAGTPLRKSRHQEDKRQGAGASTAQQLQEASPLQQLHMA
jgi:hypothetical protein